MQEDMGGYTMDLNNTVLSSVKEFLDKSGFNINSVVDLNNISADKVTLSSGHPRILLSFLSQHNKGAILQVTT